MPHRLSLMLALFAAPALAQAPSAALPPPGPQDLGLPSPRLAPEDPLRRIGHIVMIFEERRSFDNLFGLFPGVNGSFVNHSFLVCAHAFECKDAPGQVRAHFDADGRMVQDGQVTPEGFVVNTSRSIQLHAPSDTNPALLVPPRDMPHLGDRLDAAGVDWRWYSGVYDNAVAGRPDPLFQFHHQPMAYFRNLAPGTPGQQAHLKDLKDLYADIDAGRLPPVVFYKPIGELNLHPGYANITDGDEHLGKLVRRLQASPQYADMLILVTYDEHGGFWDHVAPPCGTAGGGPGIRVRLIAIGPTVRRGFIDRTQYDSGSILRSTEDRGDLPPLGLLEGRNTNMRNLLQ